MPQIEEKYPRTPYKLFKGVGDVFKPEMLQRSGALQKTFDEPTYLTFRLRFDYAHTDLEITDFDRIPMPLFNKYGEDDLLARTEYSAYQYLRDNNELLRANMLLDFIDGWNDLQMSNQWYFQEISGLDSVLDINPLRGKRVSKDGRIVIKMLEALDMRTTHLLNLYRKIAWDDTYQRWILPDMMRYFKLTVYVTEFRTFHQSNFTSRLMPGSEVPPMILEVIDGFTPVYVLEFERCEIDITSIKTIPDTLTVAENQMREMEFSIQVGNVHERYINPMLNYFYYDWMINGFNRTLYTTADEGAGLPIGPFGNIGIGIPMESIANPTKLSTSTDPNANPVLSNYAKGDILSNPSHESIKPFVETGGVDNLHNSSPNYSQDLNSVNPIDPATWLGNTLTAGKALVKNLVESKIDELKVSKIPGLGISFNEAIAAIQSKNVFTLFGAARRALEESVKDTLPSQELEGNLIDTQFRNFLLGISQSEATDSDALELKQAANMALSDTGQWEKIKDLSKATDLISTALGEINSAMAIESRNALKQAYNEQYVPQEVKDYLVFEGIPSSVSTMGRQLEGQKIQQPLAGQATSPKTQQIESGSSAELGSTDGQLSSGSTIPASSQLGSDAGEGLPQGESGLGSFAQGGMGTTNPSQQLGTSAEGGLVQGEISDRQIEGGKLNMPEPGEAVDGDPLETKPLPIPNPSKATNNKLEG